MLRGNATQNLDAGHRIEATVEPAAIRDRIDVAADQQRLRGFAAQRGPEIPRLIAVRLDSRDRLRLLAQPCARLRPGLSKCDTLRAVCVAGQGAQFLQFGNGAFRVEHER
jgi:hypothetical protein